MTAEAADGAGGGRRSWWLFAAACLVVALAGQGLRGLWEPDEGRYAECAREIVATGDWLHLTLHGRPHLTKPPGAYWAIAAGLELFGRNEFGARFFLGVAFAASALFVRLIGADLFDEAAGSRVGWIYLTMLFPVLGGSALTTDTFFTATQLGAFACVVRSWRSGRPGPWLAAAGAAFGLAFFVKGPPLLLTFAGFAAGWAWGARRVFQKSKVMSWAGAALFVALAFWWFAYMVIEDPSRADYWLKHEVVGRAFTTEHNRNNPWWIYLPVLVVGLFPWTLHALRGARSLWGDDRLVLVAAWVLVPLAGFCFFRSRLPLYVLPLAAPLALAAAFGARSPAGPLPARAGALAAWCVVLVAGRVAAAWAPSALGVDSIAKLDCGSIAKAVRAADPEGRLPVALLCGNAMYGLPFYFDGRITLLDDPRVKREDRDQSLAEYAERHRGDEWIAVVRAGGPERVARKALGPSLEPCPAPKGWLVFRVHPE